MKIISLRTEKWAFEPWEPPFELEKDKQYDLPESKALLLIKYKYAEEIKSDDSVEEQKMNSDEHENKMFNVKHEDKGNCSCDEEKPRRGRPPKN
ncbi:MAG: hypothetical protein PVJ67_03675 [Candidatus Pacearchaeota archaeon]|jgi:hypothetical protein